MRMIVALTLGFALSASARAQERPRARDIGIAPGVFKTGALNAITDVAGVRVGQVTIVEGDSVRTGVTAILPHNGNSYQERVPAALHVGNGFGKLLGVTQLTELGELETMMRRVVTEELQPVKEALAHPGTITAPTAPSSSADGSPVSLMREQRRRRRR